MTIVTRENINEVRESITALDQRQDLTIDCETWPIFYNGGQRGDITVWPHDGRAAVCWGGDSSYGAWDPKGRTITLDSGEVVTEDGLSIGNSWEIEEDE